MRLLPVISGIKCAMFIIEDLALLATGLLKGKGLADFISRSYKLL